MNVKRISVMLAVVALTAIVNAQSVVSPEAALKAAINAEVVNGDVSSAIQQYEEIATKYASNYAVASQALLRLASLYERQGKPEARATYQRILNRYADSGAAATTARARLAAIQQTAAGPFRERNVDALFDGVASEILPSPDGRYLLYARNRGAGSPVGIRVSLREIASGRERVLADMPAMSLIFETLYAVWSPDSQRVAFTISPNYPVSPAEYHILTVDGGELRKIGAGPNSNAVYRWSPDGRRLAFITGAPNGESRDLTVVNAATGVQEATWTGAVAGSSGLAWSSDSERVAFVARGASVIRTVTVATRETKDFEASGVATGSPSVRVWTPRDEIVFSSNGYFVVNTVSGATRRICGPDDRCGQVSPDGTQLFVRKAPADGERIALRDVATGRERPLTPEAVAENPVGFSRDGRLFAFQSNRDGHSAVYVVPTAQVPVGSPTRVVTLASNASRANGYWTTTGLMLRDIDDQTNLYRIEMDPRTQRPAGEPIRLTENAPANSRAFVSPDNRRIAFVWGIGTTPGAGSTRGLAVMETNGARERIVNEMPAGTFVRLLGWLSADELLFSHSNLPNSQWELSAANVTSGQTRSVGPAITGNPQSLLANGQIAASQGTDAIRIRPIAGGPERQLPALAANWYEWAMTPDGRWIAYSTVDQSAGPTRPQPGDIRIRSVETGAERVLARYPDTRVGSSEGFLYPLEFSPDGRFLLRRDPTGVFVTNVETAESWPLVAQASGLDFSGSARWSPDGSFVVFGGFTSRTSWRMFEGVTFDTVMRAMGR